MISYVPSACLTPRAGYRERKRERLIAPVSEVFAMQSDTQDAPSGSPDYSGPEELDLERMQLESAVSRLRFDMAFERAYQDIEINSQNGGEYFGIDC